VCQFKAEDTSNFKNAGVGNSRLHYSQGSMLLEYTDGDPCSDGTKRSTKIVFVCELHGPEQVVFIDEPESCKYVINWYTELACSPQVRHKLTYRRPSLFVGFVLHGFCLFCGRITVAFLRYRPLYGKVFEIE